MSSVLRRDQALSIAKLEHEIAVPGRAPDGRRQLRVVHGRQGVNLPAVERVQERQGRPDV